MKAMPSPHRTRPATRRGHAPAGLDDGAEERHGGHGTEPAAERHGPFPGPLGGRADRALATVTFREMWCAGRGRDTVASRGCHTPSVLSVHVAAHAVAGPVPRLRRPRDGPVRAVRRRPARSPARGPCPPGSTRAGRCSPTTVWADRSSPTSSTAATGPPLGWLAAGMAALVAPPAGHDRHLGADHRGPPAPARLRPGRAARPAPSPAGGAVPVPAACCRAGRARRRPGGRSPTGGPGPLLLARAGSRVAARRPSSIVDDVLTTGSTLAAAAQALRVVDVAWIAGLTAARTPRHVARHPPACCRRHRWSKNSLKFRLLTSR